MAAPSTVLGRPRPRTRHPFPRGAEDPRRRGEFGL